MTEFELNELLYRAVAMSDFFMGLIAGMCLIGLPVVMFWPRKSKVAMSPATETEKVSCEIAGDAVANHRDSELTVGFLPAVPQTSA